MSPGGWRSVGVLRCRVDLQVSFGKGDKVGCGSATEGSGSRRIVVDTQFWTNLFPTKLVASHQKDIKRFNTAIKWMRWTEAVWALVPIRISLKMWGLSEEFINYMIYPRCVEPREPHADRPVWHSSSAPETRRLICRV